MPEGPVATGDDPGESVLEYADQIIENHEDNLNNRDQTVTNTTNQNSTKWHRYEHDRRIEPKRHGNLPSNPGRESRQPIVRATVDGIPQKFVTGGKTGF